ncbi:hypothetical protein LINPERHAP1_LOCUS39117 [Linum perenne]
MHQHVVDIAALRELLERDWEVTISHIYREGNFVADYLANLGHDYTWGVHLISVSDCNLSYFLKRYFPKKKKTNCVSKNRLQGHNCQFMLKYELRTVKHERQIATRFFKTPPFCLE